MTVDSQAMELNLSAENIKKIRTEAQNFLTLPEALAHSAVQLLGKLNSMQLTQLSKQPPCSITHSKHASDM